MEDIAPDLLEKIQSDFKEQFEKDKTITDLAKKLEIGTATHSEAYSYAGRVGSILTEAYQRNLSTDSLPDGKLWYNIANRVITPTMQNNYDIITKYVSGVQANLNREAGIGIKPIKPELNTDRIRGIVNKVSNADTYDDVSWVLDEPVKNFSESIVDDSIRKNAEFHGKSGMRPKIIRKSSGTCCDWCNEVAGTFYYPDVPKDVYRRHNRCNCTVEYDPGDGKVQNVWSKGWRDQTESDKIDNRKDIIDLAHKYDRNYARADQYLDYSDTPPVPAISPDEIIEELETSPIGKETLRYIIESGIKPQIIYEPNNFGIRGDQRGTEIRIFMSNISNSRVAAQTVIHEVTHYRYDIGNCQWAEAVCMANEKRHIEGRDQLTQDELKYIVSLVKKAYPEYEWKKGGYYGNRRF